VPGPTRLADLGGAEVARFAAGMVDVGQGGGSGDDLRVELLPAWN
jgi:hypothetical protein